MRVIVFLIGLSFLPSLVHAQDKDMPWVDPAALQEGRPRNELTRDQSIEIAKIQRSLSEVDDLPLEEWMEGFRRDDNPDREIEIWKHIAAVYTDFTKGKQVLVDYKREVFKVLVACSMMPREAVPVNTGVRILTAKELIAVMDLYYGE